MIVFFSFKAVYILETIIKKELKNKGFDSEFGLKQHL